MEFDQDFSEFVELLARHDVRYMIVGGYALAAHGLPRATGDLDAWIWTDSTNAHRLLLALDEFGFGGVGIEHDDLTSPDCVVQLGYPPYRIDILTRLSGLDFEAAWARHIEVVLGGVMVPFIGREDLITNKRATGRPQDVADVLRLTGEAPRGTTGAEDGS
jgi:hypothetical protein